MIARTALGAALILFTQGCAQPATTRCNDPGTRAVPATPPRATPARPPGNPKAAITKLLDDWHVAAATAKEQPYFAALSEDAVFLGTDATERWSKEAFRTYAHPHFAKGKAWSLSTTRRAIQLSDDGNSAWFDEDLATPNLGPARGSGVVVYRGGRWLIAHYNLTITVPNDRFAAVKKLLEAEPSSGEGPPTD